MLVCALAAFGPASAQEPAALSHAERARLLTLAESYPAALLEWREAIRLAPSNSLFHNLYGLALEQSGNGAAARAEFRSALRLKSDFVDAQNNLAYSLWHDHQQQQAATETDRALRLSPADASLHLLRGQLFAHAADRSSACREFELAAPWPTEPAFMWQIMENCLAAGNAKVALKAAAFLPPDGETQLSIGLWLLAADQPNESVVFLRSAVSRSDPHAQASLWLAEAYSASCEPSKALALLSEARFPPEYDYQVRDLRASAVLALGRESEAESQFRSLVDNFPNVPAAYVAATQVALRQRRWADALTILNAGLGRMPGSWLLLFRRGVVYKLSGNPVAAKADFLDSLKYGGEAALVAAALGDLEAENGDLSGAADLFKRTWQETKLPQFHLAYALALDRMGDSQKALAELREAEKSAPQDAQLHYTLGKMLSREGHLKEAEAQFEKARQMAPGLAVNLYALGRAYLAQGESTKAKEVMAAFQKAKWQTAAAVCKPL